MKTPDLSKIKALILDMDGVVWRGNQPLGDLPQVFAKISMLGYRVNFATNNATVSPQKVQEKLLGFGLQVALNQIVTSSIATVSYLLEKYPQGGPVFVVGEEGLVNPLRQAGFFVSEENCLAVVASLDHTFDFEKLSKANAIIRQGAEFIGTNPDKTFPSPHGLTPGSGSVLAAIEAASETRPNIMGKPYPKLFQVAFKSLSLSADECLAVGDRLDTDILGGHNAGCMTAQVLTGVSNRAQGEAYEPRPDWIVASLTDLVNQLPERN